MPIVEDLFSSKPLTTNRKIRVGLGPVGCSFCPLNTKARKIIGLKRLRGRPIHVWAEAPGGEEDKKGLELVGAVGKLLWREFKKIGIVRDQCETSNVVKCRPTKKSDYGNTVNRTPTSKEIHCCSHWTKRLQSKSKASVYLVLGAVARKAMFGDQAKTQRVFYSDDVQAWVVCTVHPSYLLRDPNDREKLAEFRAALKTVKQLMGQKGRYGFIKSQDYRELKTVKSIRLFLRFLRKHRPTIDIENGVVNGKHVILCVAFCWKPGHSRCIVLDHSESRHGPKARRIIKRLMKRYLEDPKCEKVFQHGSHDVVEFEKKIKAFVPSEAYTFDSEYAGFLYDTDRKKTGLATLAADWFPEFSGYKDIVGVQIKNYADVPLKKLLLRCNADADVTKRVELKTRPHISLPLLKVYSHAAFMFQRMEEEGPFLDRKFAKRIRESLPTRLNKLRRRVQFLSGDPSLDLNSPLEVEKHIYDKLKIPIVEQFGRNTQKATLKFLAVRHPKWREFLTGVVKLRGLRRTETAVLNSFERSADLYGGRITTIYWMTGAGTGRVSSGGSKDVARKGIVNLQNVAKDPLIKNLLVSDLNWEKLLDPNATEEELGNIWVFLGGDYGQVEVREMAELSGDRKLITIFRSGKDIHCQVGVQAAGLSWDEVKNNEITRTFVKNTHFNIIYGGGVDSVYHRLVAEGVKGVTRKKVEKFRDGYWRVFKTAKRYMDGLVEFAREHGYVETMFGLKRKIYIGEHDSGNDARNSVVQGTAHQLLLMAIASCYTRPVRYSLLQRPAQEIHDQVVFYVQIKNLREACKQLHEVMEKAVPKYVKREFGKTLKVPLISDCKAGPRAGVMVKGVETMTVMEFVKAWRKENAKVEAKIAEEIAK